MTSSLMAVWDDFNGFEFAGADLDKCGTDCDMRDLFESVEPAVEQVTKDHVSRKRLPSTRIAQRQKKHLPQKCAPKTQAGKRPTEAKMPSILKGHKIARGRGRQGQLLTMTEEQKEAEVAWRLRKNRDAARESRRRKKQMIEDILEENAQLRLENEELRRRCTV